MSVYVDSRSRSAEIQMWEHLGRMRDAGLVAHYYLAAHERRAWAIATGRAAQSGTSMTRVTAKARWRWIGTRLRAVTRRPEGKSHVQSVDDDRVMRIQCHLAN